VRLPHPGHSFGVGSSPLLYDGLLILPRDGGPEAAVLAYDAGDGSELWRIDRFDYGESHGTPFLWRNAERDELVISGTARLCSYDPGTGERLWIVKGLTNFPCTTATADEDTLYFAAWSTSNATGRSFWDAAFTRSLELTDEEVEDPALLFKRLDANGDGKVVLDEVPECRAKDAFGFIDGDQNGSWEVEEMTSASSPGGMTGKNLMVSIARGAEGEVGDEHLRWSWSRGLPYVSSPLLYRGRIWLIKSGGLISCLDAESGKPILDRERLEDRSEYYLSPVGASGHVIVGSAEGTLYLIDADADELVIQHTATFDEELFATPAVLAGTVYLRSKSTLWAFGQARD
jgi:outer membrane protein assembly factor BamB